VFTTALKNNDRQAGIRGGFREVVVKLKNEAQVVDKAITPFLGQTRGYSQVVWLLVYNMTSGVWRKVAERFRSNIQLLRLSMVLYRSPKPFYSVML